MEGTSGPTWSTSASSTAQTGMFTYDPGYTSTARCESALTYHRRRRRRAAPPRLPDRPAGRAFELHGSRLPAAQRRTAERRTSYDRLQGHDHPPHHAARPAAPVLPGLPPRRAPDGDHVRRGRRADRVLPRQHRHLRSRSSQDQQPPADRQDADDRRDGLQVLGRPAVHAAEQLAVLHRQLPAHDLRRPGRGLRGGPGSREGDGPDLHPARRPRAERLDLDRAARRLVGRQPVRLHRRGHRLPVGPGAWRRQRGGAQHAARDRHARTASRTTSSAPRTRTTRSG